MSDELHHRATCHRVGESVVLALAGEIDLIAEDDSRAVLDTALTLLAQRRGTVRPDAVGCDAGDSAEPCAGTAVTGTSAVTDMSGPGGGAESEDAGVGLGGVAGRAGMAGSSGSTAGSASAEHAVLVMDLSAVTFFSSTGLQLLVTAGRAAAARGVALRVATGTHRSVRRTLQLTGLDTAFDTFVTCADALAECSPRVSG